jgi:hypothetical protein
VKTVLIKDITFSAKSLNLKLKVRKIANYNFSAEEKKVIQPFKNVFNRKK